MKPHDCILQMWRRQARTNQHVPCHLFLDQIQKEGANLSLGFEIYQNTPALTISSLQRHRWIDWLARHSGFILGLPELLLLIHFLLVQHEVNEQSSHSNPN